MASRHDPFLDDADVAVDASASLPPALAFDEPAPDPAQDDAGATDPLLHALSWLTRHHGRERSAASLRSELPADSGAIGPDQALRLLRQAGFNAGVVRRPLRDLSAMLMPAVLLLRHGEACVVTGREGAAGDDAARYHVVMPGPEHHQVTAAGTELAAEYTGYCLLATPRLTATPSMAADPALRDPASHWLWGTLRRFMPYYRSALVAAMLSNVLMLVSGLVTTIVYDKVIPHQAFVTLWTLAAGAGLALLFDLFARQLRSHLIDSAGKKADLLIGSALFRQTLAVRMEHRPASAGSYGHTLGQIEIVRDFFTSSSLATLSDLPFVVLFVAMIFVVGGPLGWVMVVAIPLILGVSVVIQGSLRRAMAANMHVQADLQGVLVEAVEGLEDVKTAGASGQFLKRYEDATAAGAETALRARRLSSWTTNLSSTTQQAVTLVMLVWGVYLIDAGTISAGSLIGAVMFAGRAVAPLSSLVSLATRYQGARAAMTALDRLMSLPTEREAGRSYVAQPAFSGRIGLHDVGFSYPPTSDQAPPRVLAGVTLRFEPGERVAILGRIGSGKSTILRLLAGLYLPTEGLVEVDGLDLRQIDPADYRPQVGFVSQEPRLFNGTLRDNVTMGRPEVDAGRLAAVARLTGLDRLVSHHPQGWELPVGEMGALLSGGQRQLVALARCLATQPPILLMDEPTSSMDAQSELAFLRQLKEAAGQRTLIMVTHRPAVLELVQRVVVVDGGRVVMDGPKAQVLAALSGARPAATNASAPASSPAAGTAAGGAPNLHLHPSAQPMQREAAL